MTKILYYSCASRGRSPENPSDRRSGINLEQRLEISEEPEISNCLTSVSKDAMVLEVEKLNKVTLKINK